MGDNSNALVWLPLPNSRPLEVYLQSLKKLKKRAGEFTTIYPDHGTRVSLNMRRVEETSEPLFSQLSRAERRLLYMVFAQEIQRSDRHRPILIDRVPVIPQPGVAGAARSLTGKAFLLRRPFGAFLHFSERP